MLDLHSGSQDVIDRRKKSWARHEGQRTRSHTINVSTLKGNCSLCNTGSRSAFEEVKLFHVPSLGLHKVNTIQLQGFMNHTYF